MRERPLRSSAKHAAEAVVAEALPLLQSEAGRQRMADGYRRLRQALGEPGVTRRAAAAILDAVPSPSP